MGHLTKFVEGNWGGGELRRIQEAIRDSRTQISVFFTPIMCERVTEIKLLKRRSRE